MAERSDHRLVNLELMYRPDEDQQNVMTYGSPRPQPVIRQVPRE